MRIHDVCRQCGLTKKAVEYYEKQGLVWPLSDENGYRNFSRDDVNVLQEIATLRKLGADIPDIREIISSQDKCKALSDYQVKMEHKLQKANAQYECLDYLRKNGCDLAGSIDFIERKLDESTAIKDRLLQAFPGSFGVFLHLHFGRFLGGPIDTAEKAVAYRNIVTFLDGLAGVELPDGLESYLAKAFSGLNGEVIQEIDDGMLAAAGNYQDFIAKNREAVDAYLEYRGSDAFRSSPAYQMKQCLVTFQKSSGYLDVFLPNMRALSPSYREYTEKLRKANEAFLLEYPDALVLYDLDTES